MHLVIIDLEAMGLNALTEFRLEGRKLSVTGIEGDLKTPGGGIEKTVEVEICGNNRYFQHIQSQG